MDNVTNIDPRRISMDMRYEVEGLIYKAEEIEILANEAGTKFHELSQNMAKNYGYEFGDFKTLSVFMRVIEQQANLIHEVCARFETHAAA